MASSPAKRRRDRLSQQRHRGGKHSPLTQAENASILLALEAGELTEGQAAKALGVDRVSCRLLREEAIGRGIALAAALRPVSAPEPLRREGDI